MCRKANPLHKATAGTLGVRRSLAAYLSILFAMLPLTAACTAAPATIVSTPTIPALIRAEDSWIEVVLAQQVLRLHEGSEIVGEYAAASGAADYPTPPGLYRVQMMEKGPIENVPGVWVSDILIFHFGKDIGIHSMPMDADGNVLDPTLGQPATGGCVRVGDAATVFEFAELGMRVWIH